MKNEIPVDLARTHAAWPGAAQVHLPGARSIPDKSGQVGGFGNVAILFNEYAHHNKRAAVRTISSWTWQAPHNKADLDRALAEFARQKIGTLIIDGGDGTVRDVLSLAKRHFTDGLPRFAIIPSGKTNALAGDLGIHSGTSAHQNLRMLHTWKTVRRSPIEIRYGDEREARLRGFIFGTGAFVRATNLAQSVHNFGALNGLAVGLSMIGALAQTVFGDQTNPWRRGDSVTVEMGGRAIKRNFYILLASTLERMPLGARPFGKVRSGLKLLGVDAPPRRLLLSAAALVAGSEREWLSDAGCKRADPDRFRLRLDGDFVLDGECFPGGDLTISKGAPVEFLVPG